MASRAGGRKDAGNAYPFSSIRGLASKGWTRKVGMSPRIVPKFTVQNDIMLSHELCQVTPLRKVPGCIQPWPEPAELRCVEVRVVLRLLWLIFGTICHPTPPEDDHCSNHGQASSHVMRTSIATLSTSHLDELPGSEARSLRGGRLYFAYGSLDARVVPAGGQLQLTALQRAGQSGEAGTT